MMRRHLERLVGWLCLSLLLCTAACGPGTGGTGTGPVVSVAPQSSTALSYNSQVSSVPSGVSVFGPGLIVPVKPETILLQFLSDSITVTGTCFKFQYKGLWQFSTSGEASVTGDYQLTNTVNGKTEVINQSAVLTLLFANGQAYGDRLLMVLRDAEGKDLEGPFDLQLGLAQPPATFGPGCTY